MCCQCCAAALRTYRELAEAGQREDRAYDAAVQVFRYSHPECHRVEAYQIVGNWLDKKDAGIDPGGNPWEASPDPE